MRDLLALHQSILAGEASQRRGCCVGSADEHHEGGDRQQQRAFVGVAGPQDRIHLQSGALRSRQVDRVTVVDDALEHSDGPDAHGRSLPPVEPPTDDPDELLALAAEQLIAAVNAAIEPWAMRQIVGRAPQLAAPAEVAAAEVHELAVTALRRLVGTDIDHQRATPLQIVRSSVGPLTEVLGAGGVVPPDRDGRGSATEITDPYSLGPASWAEFGDDVNEAGLRWGAAKAMVHLRRRRDESR